VRLLKLIDIKGMDEVKCYKAANVSRQTWYKIMNEGDYRPSKNTVICFAISLSLDY
jgi:predicted transcriptional regulator